MDAPRRLTCPYHLYPDYQHWKKTVGAQDYASIDPVIRVPFRIVRSDKIATAGSCFAQRMARHLRAKGYNYHITEPKPPFMPDAVAERHHFGVYSARYGNVYTTRQLLQLMRRAFKKFTPVDDCWEEDGRFIDPYRSTVNRAGYATLEDMQADRAHHLSRVRLMVRQADVLVFTLGLTEAWTNAADGAVYPVCPGCGGGTFDPERHVFKNFDHREVSADLRAAIKLMRMANPDLKIILTVSPVSIAATGEDRHVVHSNLYSKSTLCAAANDVARAIPDVAYFPSYEIVASPASRGRYYADDLRELTEEGVAHVMDIFTRHFIDESGEPLAPQPRTDAEQLRHERAMQVICDEELYADVP
jgi:GSCFA family protein